MLCFRSGGIASLSLQSRPLLRVVFGMGSGSGWNWEGCPTDPAHRLWGDSALGGGPTSLGPMAVGPVASESPASLGSLFRGTALLRRALRTQSSSAWTRQAPEEVGVSSVQGFS